MSNFACKKLAVTAIVLSHASNICEKLWYCVGASAMEIFFLYYLNYHFQTKKRNIQHKDDMIGSSGTNKI